MTTLLLAATAVAEEHPPIDAIVASEAQEGEPASTPWTLTLEEVERDYPAVARAVKSPNFIVSVSEAEQESTHAYFAKLSEHNASVVLVDGRAYSVGITIGQGAGNLPPGGGDASATGSVEEKAAARTVPAGGLLVGLALVGGSALALRRRS